jgi:hypothetical protein
MNFKDVEIKINCSSKDETTIRKVFDTIDKARDLAIREIDNPETPELTELDIIYDGEKWSLHEARDWRPMAKPRVIKLYVYDKENKKWDIISDWSKA